MHSYQPSRGRVLFEVLCALGIVASCVGAWRQTEASALLLAAAIAGLYGFVHLFDLTRRSPAGAEEPQLIAFEPEVAEQLPVELPVVEMVPPPAIASSLEEEAAAPRTGAGRRKGGSRKGSGRRSGPRKVAEVVPLAAVEEVVAPKPVPFAAEPSEPVVVEEAVAEEFAEPWPQEEAAHSPVAPLFEPEPFVRMPRQAFGRRGRL